MLRLLRIRNLAVIEAVDVELDAGFNVLTGETGAGKSILVGAVGLLLGARASADLVRTGESVATIEAIFEDPRRGDVLVRREVTSQGRSRSFIDGALATSGALRELAAGLVELHGQHEHHALLDAQSHLAVLDGWAGLEADVARVGAHWAALRALRERRDRARMDSRERAARLDLVSFQLDDIQKAAPLVGEDDELGALRQVLVNAERVQRLCAEGYDLVYDDERSALTSLAQAWKRVDELAAIDARFQAHLEFRDGIKAQLDDLAALLRQYGGGIDASPARLQAVEDRLALLDRLKRKYGPTLQEVVDRGAALGEERDLLRGDEGLEGLERALEEATATYLEAARALSARRQAAAREFAHGLETMLEELAMGTTRFEVRFGAAEAPEQQWGADGLDQAEFFVSPNPGEDLRPLARIVSGGELSRVMLALKTMSARAGTGQTLVFDEVDAGIGGRVADVVGERLRHLGQSFQVLCITHLPQIASRATTHLQIDKLVRGRRTMTTVRRLDETGRVEEIGRMIGGATLSPAVRASAREMLSGHGDAGKAKGKRKAKGESETG